MINKQAEINYRYRLYNACRGMLRLKQAAVEEEELNAIRDAGATSGDRDAAFLRGLGGRAADGMDAFADRRHSAYEGLGERVGAGIRNGAGYLADKARQGVNAVYDAGRRTYAGAQAAGAYANRVAHGAVNGVQDFGKRGIDRLMGEGHFAVDHPLSGAAGLAAGYFGGKAGYNGGNWVADKFGLDDDDWRRKALSWGGGALAGLGSGIFGMHLAHGLGKGLRGSRSAGGATAPATAPAAAPPADPAAAPVDPAAAAAKPKRKYTKKTKVAPTTPPATGGAV